MESPATAAPQHACRVPLSYCPPFERVKPSQLAAVWPRVEKGLREVLSKGREPWTPKHIHDRLMGEHAALFACEHGFVILEQCDEPISRKKFLNVWVMWMEPGEGLKNRERIFVWLDAMRLAHKCEWWEFRSPRDGWAGRVEPHCERYMTIWRKY